MKSVDRIRVSTDARWIELLEQLHERRDLLADRFMMEINGGDLYYEDRVDADELRETSMSAFEFILAELRGKAMLSAGRGTPPRPDADFPHRVGTRRARQGVEGQKLTAAIQQDFGIMWSSLLWLANSGDALTLAVHVQDVWGAVDAFAGRIHNAFMEERMIMTRENSMSKQSLVARLLSDDPQPPGLAARASASLAIAEDSRLWAVAALSADDDELRIFAERLRRQGRSAYSHTMGGCTVVFWSASSADGTSLIGAGDGWRHSSDAAALREVTCGVAPLHHGLSNIREAVAVACEIAVMIPAGFTGPAAMSDVWSFMAQASLSARMPQFVAGVLHGIAGATDGEREVLLSTVREYARTGDINATSTALFCHRNTVMKRLRRFRELTGLDMSIPEHAAQAFIALAHHVPTRQAQ